MNDNQFDKIDKLLISKSFDQLSASEKEMVLQTMTKEEYMSMHQLYEQINESQPDEIEPSLNVKSKLDKVFLQHHRKERFFMLKTPLYQSAAVAVVFFLLGFGLNYFKQTPERIIYQPKEIVRYVDRPVKQIEYVKVIEKQYIQSTDNSIKKSDEETIQQRTQNEIAENNNYLNGDSIGESMENDTLLKQMLVTLN